MPPTSFTLDGHTFTVTDPLRTGTLADFYRVEYEAGGVTDGPGKTVFDRLLEDDMWATASGVAKLTRDPADNDLADHDREMLQRVFPPGAAEEKFRRYLPRLLAHGRHEGRAVLVFPLYRGFVSMEEVKRAFPAGLDFRDVVWQWKRCLAALWFVHRQGVVNGGMLPNNIMVHPVDHGAKILEWSFAAESRGRIRAGDASYGAFWAPEIARKLEALPATDLYMLSKTVLWLLGGNVETNELPPAVPAELQAFLLTCLRHERASRPNDAGEVHEELDKLLLRLVGKPSYRRLTLPGWVG